ncbi:hypothetical protein [Dyadobacter diqingensis]|uniref:hypothetical protein n=1 Tax=Dyadobacter diqingensis TaxID=2938121 RepID=UPI0020C5905E|nr:hypothetical protein [Dyadobacter diqingensis]
MLFPVKIRLAKHEAEQLTMYVLNKSIGILRNPDVRNDLIVLAEFSEKLQNKFRSHRQKPTNKPVVYTIPLSVARILHLRFQKEDITPVLQWVLASLDQELVNMSMKPKFPTQLF